MPTNIDASVNNEIFRRDNIQIIASNRPHALIYGVRVKSRLTVPYVAGTVLGRLDSAAGAEEGLYATYVDGSSGASAGLATAAGILLDSLEAAASGGNELARCLFKGEAFQAKLIGLDAAAIVDLKARSIIGGDGVQVLSF